MGLCDCVRWWGGLLPVILRGYKKKQKANMRSLARLAAGARQFSTSAARQGGVADYGGIPMGNWPFSVKNRVALTLGFSCSVAVDSLSIHHGQASASEEVNKCVA